MDEEGALTLAIENPSVIKRPLLVMGKDMHIGFNEAQYADIFKIEEKAATDGTTE